MHNQGNTYMLDIYKFFLNIYRILLGAICCALLLSAPAGAIDPKPDDASKLVTTPTEETAVPAATKPKDIPIDEEPLTSASGSYLSSYVAHNSGDVTNAIRYLEKVLAKDSKNVNIRSQLLVLRILSGDIEQAIDHATLLQNVENRELIVDLLLAVNQIKDTSYQKASKTLGNAQSQSFDHIWLPVLQAWLASKEEKAPPITAEKLLGEQEKAPPSFIYYHLGLINQLRGQNTQALSDFEAAIANKEKAP